MIQSQVRQISSVLPPLEQGYPLNLTSLQADFSLTYTGNNIYFLTSFCPDLPKGKILAILNLDAPMGLLPLGRV